MNDDGPAFPSEHTVRGNPPNVKEDGMSLRDWFAGQILSGVVSRDVDGNLEVVYTAEQVYLIADAMLKVRQ